MKQFVTATLLRLRPHYPGLFRYGDWLPLKVSGEREEHLIVYARVKDGEVLIVAVPRLVLASPITARCGAIPRWRYPRRWQENAIGICSAVKAACCKRRWI